MRKTNPQRFGKEQIVSQVRMLSNLLEMPLQLESQMLEKRRYRISYNGGSRHLSPNLTASEMQDWLHGALSVAGLLKHGRP
jgi:hypothetical protein